MWALTQRSHGAQDFTLCCHLKDEELSLQLILFFTRPLTIISCHKPPLKQEYFDISKHHYQTINCAHGSRLARKSSSDLRKEKSIFDYKFHAILQNTFAFSYVCCSSFVVWLLTHSLSIYLMPSLVTSTADPMQLISFQNKKSMLCLACMKIHQ